MAVTVSVEKTYYNGAWFIQEAYNGQEWRYYLPSVDNATNQSREDLIELRDLLNAVLDA
jgi:hypothetical protein